jgi:ATP-binding cassette subfamily F protein 3
LLALEDQSAGYDGRQIIGGLNLSIAPGDRLALLGRNGAGKSTVMKLLAGELPAMGGVRTEARDMKLGYFAQHQLEQLAIKQSPLQQLQELDESMRAGAGRAPEQELRDFLGGFGFRGDRVFEPVGPFSGGEKARLVLALVVYRRPNLLLLDEPTNHLDLEMRQALAVALQDYEGAVVLVSHDRHLLRTVADEFRLVAAGRAEPFDGDLEDYAQWLADEPAGTAGVGAASAAAATAVPATIVAAAKAPGPATETADVRKQRKRAEAQRRAALGPLRTAVAEQERKLESLGTEQAKLERELLAASEAADSARVAILIRDQARVVKAIAAAESAWMKLSTDLEAQMEAQTVSDSFP